MIISEIGWNFLGDINLAKKMIDAAVRAGCRYIKFQLWNPKNLKRGAWDEDGRREIYNKSYLDEKKYFLSEEKENTYRIKKRSMTRNSNIIFTLVFKPKNTSDNGLSKLGEEIKKTK